MADNSPEGPPSTATGRGRPGQACPRHGSRPDTKGPRLKTENVRYRVFIGAAFALGAALLLRLTQRPDAFETSLMSASSLAIWVALVSIAAPSPLPLGRGRGTVSLTTALDLAALLLFGPAIACWVATLSRLIMCTAERWNPLVPGIARMAESMLAVGIAGLAYLHYGGRVGADLALTESQVVPLLAAIGIYLVIKHGLALVSFRLRSPRAEGESVLQQLQLSLPGDLVVLPFGVLLAWTQALVGPVGMALFLVPLLLARHFFNHWVDTKKSLVNILRTMMTAVDAADPLTWGYSDRISRMCVAVGRRLQLSHKELEDLEVAALLHDIGRTAILREILVKPGKLSSQERSALHTHPTVGRDIVAGLQLFGEAADIVHAHHEQPDGKGYPRGLKGDEIPVGSRILMVVSAFDALTSDRPYRRGLAPEAAIEELLAHSGTQFHPDAVEALVKLYSTGDLFEDFPEAQLAQYSEGRGNSRAIAEFLSQRDGEVQVPDKRDVAPPAARKHETGARILELPAPPPMPAVQNLRVAAGDDGQAWMEATGRSDVGRVRKNNEDSLLLKDCSAAGRGSLLLVADGMGGAAAGEVASRLATEVVESVYASSRSGSSAAEALARAVKAANTAVHAHAASDGSMTGMGTTCTALAVVGRDVFMAHVGDSRAYLVRAGAISQITQDHSLAAEMAAAGGSTVQVSRNLLTRSLGAQEQVEVDTLPAPIRLESGAMLLLCSDGVSNMITDEEFLEILSEEAPAEATETVIDLARERGAPDNLTVVVARFEEGQGAE